MPASPPDGDAVRAQLERILASPGFANAGRLSRFLRFVVERTLDGEGDQLKEYRLGTEVFDRSSDYDPRLDSIVRVEARRLRSKLAEYYEGPGRVDPIAIRVDKGSYGATFETTTPESIVAAAPSGATFERTTPESTTPGLATGGAPGRVVPPPPPRRWLPFALAVAGLLLAVLAGWQVVGRHTAAASSRIQVAVLPLTRYDTAADVVPEALADAVTDGLIAELARHAAVEVTSRTSVMPFRDRRVPLATIASTLGVQAVVEGRIQVTGSRLWVEVRLVDARRDRKVWVDDFAGDTSDRRALERRVAAALVPVLTARFGPGVE
jgi:TolB-like protein